MATQTFQHSSFGGGIVRIEYDINDATWRVTRVRCINHSASSARAVILESGIQRFIAIAPPNVTTQWNVTGVQLGWDEVNGGIMMGAYVMQAAWPWGSG